MGAGSKEYSEAWDAGGTFSRRCGVCCMRTARHLVAIAGQLRKYDGGDKGENVRGVRPEAKTEILRLWWK